MIRVLLFLLVFLVNSSFAAVDWQRKTFLNLSGGLNDAFDPVSIADNEAADLKNVVFDEGGNFKTRDGYATVNSSTVGASTTCMGISYYEQADGDQFLAAVFDDNKIYKMDYNVGGGPDGTWDDITGSLTFVNSNTIYASFAVAEDTLIVEDGIGTTAPYKWTGTGNAAALGGSPANATMVAYHKRHLFSAGNSTAPSTLYFSDLDDIENWTTGLSGSVPVETNDGSVIRALVPGFDSLYIFKDHSIWRLSGEDKDNFQLQRMIADIGTLSKNSVALLGSDMIFMSDQGDVFLYDGGIKVRKISSKIDGTLEGANFSRFQYAQSAIFNDDYYISLASSGSGTNDIILLFDTFHLSWTKFDGFNASAISVVDDGLDEDLLVFGDATGFVYKYPSGTNDNGTAIDTSYVTKQYFFPDLMPRKNLKEIHVYANQKGNYNLSVETRVDFQSTGTTDNINLQGSNSLYGTAVYGTGSYGGENLVIGEIEPREEGRFFQLKFSNSNLDEPIEVKGWDMWLDEFDRI